MKIIWKVFYSKMEISQFKALCLVSNFSQAPRRVFLHDKNNRNLCI